MHFTPVIMEKLIKHMNVMDKHIEKLEKISLSFNYLGKQQKNKR